MITRIKLLAVAASALAVTGCVTPYANDQRPLCQPDRQRAGHGEPDALLHGAGLHGQLCPRHRQARPAHRRRPRARLHRQGRPRRRPQGHAGRIPDGDVGLLESRRPPGRAFRHVGLRTRTEIRQQPPHRRRCRPVTAGRARIPPDPGRRDPRLGLLLRRRHHRTQLQHPLDRR